MYIAVIFINKSVSHTMWCHCVILGMMAQFFLIILSHLKDTTLWSSHTLIHVSCDHNKWGYFSSCRCAQKCRVQTNRHWIICCLLVMLELQIFVDRYVIYGDLIFGNLIETLILLIDSALVIADWCSLGHTPIFIAFIWHWLRYNWPINYD